MNFKRLAELKVGPAGEEGILITNLRMAFEQVEDEANAVNHAMIKVYNLSINSRNRLKTPNQRAILKIGYQNGANTSIFAGEITLIDSIKDNADIITNLYCAEGFNSILRTRVNLSYSGSINPITILEKIANDIGLDGVDITANLDNNYNGFVYAGRAKEVIQNIANRYDAKFYIRDNVLFVIPKAARAVNTIRVAPSSGLIGSPQTIRDINEGAGVKVVTQLNPQVSVGSTIVLDTQNFKGSYRVFRLMHRGDTHSNVWESELSLC